jgi:hypothetical protein
MRQTQSKPLIFAELEEGDLFIVFPVDGDDKGHGGFRAGCYLMKKTQPFPQKETWMGPPDNYFRCCDGMRSHWPDEMEVIKICEPKVVKKC